MKRVIAAVLAAAGRVIIGLLVLLVAVGVLQQFGLGIRMGFGYAVVVSGSMEPNIHVNDVLVFQKHRRAEYHPGDVVLYLRGQGTPDEMLISHRIIAIDGDTLTTKGDANMAEDPPVSFNQVVGRVVIRVPYVGRAVRFMRTTPGLILAAFIIVLLIVLSIILPNARGRKKVKTVGGEQEIKY